MYDDVGGHNRETHQPTWFVRLLTAGLCGGRLLSRCMYGCRALVARLFVERSNGRRLDGDVVSVIVVTVAVLFSALFGLLEVSWVQAEGLRANNFIASESSIRDDAARDYSEVDVVLDVPAPCVVDVAAVARSKPCGAQARQAWIFGASNVLRRSMGAPPCWWHASAAELTEIRGIQISYAMLAVKARDHVEGPRLPLELSELLGERRARLLNEGSTVVCALQPR